MEVRLDVADTGTTLNLRQDRFALEYVTGEDAGNGSKCYAKIYDVKDMNVAAACAARLLTNAKVQEAIIGYRQEVLDQAMVVARPWIDLVPEAQSTLLSILRGDVTSGAHVRLSAAREILDRALGKPKESVEVSDRTQVDAAVAAFLGRIHQRQQQKVN